MFKKGEYFDLEKNRDLVLGCCDDGGMHNISLISFIPYAIFRTGTIGEEANAYDFIKNLFKCSKYREYIEEIDNFYKNIQTGFYSIWPGHMLVYLYNPKTGEKIPWESIFKEIKGYLFYLNSNRNE